MLRYVCMGRGAWACLDGLHTGYIMVLGPSLGSVASAETDFGVHGALVRRGPPLNIWLEIVAHSNPSFRNSHILKLYSVAFSFEC